MKQEYIQDFLIEEQNNVIDAMQKIDKNAKGIVFAVDEKNCLSGAVTDGDIRRWLMKTADMQADLKKFMNAEPITATDKQEAAQKCKEHQIKVLPIVNERREVLDIFFQEKKDIYKGRTGSDALKDVPVVIMAGGKGTRLYPFTKILPKPLIPIGDIPIMERIVRKFCDFGAKNFFVTLNYKKNMIKSYFGDLAGDFHMEYVEENKPLGTGGSLTLLEDKLDRPFILSNCDSLIHADYENIYENHIKSGNDLTIVSALKNITVPYGVIHAAENGAVMSMEEKPRLSYLINTGMYVINPEVIRRIPKDTFYHMTNLAEDLLKNNGKVGMYPVSEDSFLDMGEFEEMRRMEDKLNLKSAE